MQKRKLFIDRKDGKRVENVSGLSQISIDLKPRRCDSDVYINQKVDVTNLVEYINKCFSNRKLLKKCIYRFILQGHNSDEAIDGIIYGVVDDFLFISSGDVLKILLKHSEDYHNGVHFSDLFCQAKAKNLNNNPKHEKDRYCVQVKWFNLFDCILESNYDKNIEKQNIK